MDAGADRPGVVDRQRGRTDRADAGRRHHRCREIGAPGRGACDRDHRLRGARLCRYADLSGGRHRRHDARRRKLRAGTGDCRDQSRSGRALCDRRTARAQRALCLARQRRRRRRDGDLRLSAVEPLGVPRYLLPGDPDLAVAGAHPGGRCRRRPCPWFGAARGAGSQDHAGRRSRASEAAIDLRRQRDAAAACKCRDAADHGGRGDGALGSMGAGADRVLYRRAAGDRGADVADRRRQGARVGQAAVADDRFRRACDPRPAVRDRARSISAGRRAVLRRHHCLGLCGDDSADRRRCRLRHRSFQSGAGNRRHRDRHRRIAVDGGRRLRHRRLWQRRRIPRPCHDRGARICGDRVSDAGDAAALHRRVKPTPSCDRARCRARRTDPS